MKQVFIPASPLAYVFMTLGAVGLTLGDFFIKRATHDGVSFITLLVFASPLTFFGLVMLAHSSGGIAYHLTPKVPTKLIIRAALLLIMSFLNVTSLALNPYGQHAILFQLSPVFALIISIFILGERATWHTRGVLTICVVGTFLVVNPQFDGINVTLLIAVAAALANALTNTFVAANRSAATPIGFTFWAVIGIFPVALLLWLANDRTVPEFEALVSIQLSALFAISGIVLVSLAMQQAVGNVGVVGIMLYVQMPVALILGWIAFSEVPSVTAIFGAILIAVAGISIPLRTMFAK